MGLFFSLPINSATFLFANNINSSINLLAAFDSLKNTPVGFAFSSKLNFTSTLSKDIAPSFILCFLRIFANSFNFNVASTIASET